MSTQYLRYIRILNNIKSVLLTNEKLTPGNANSYITSMYRQKYIPAAGQLPAILIYVGQKPVEPHDAIGYTPSPIVTPAIRVVCGFPEENTTTASLVALDTYHSGITKILTPEQSDDEVYTIMDEIESTIRISGKKLNDPDYVLRALPSLVRFDVEPQESGFANYGELFLDIKLKHLVQTS